MTAIHSHVFNVIMDGKENIPGSPTPGIFQICSLLVTESMCIEYLRNIGLLPKTLSCKICNMELKIVRKGDSNDGEISRCSNCYSKRSIRSGSLFENSKLRFTVLVMIIYLFGIDLQIYQVQKLIPGIAHTSIIEWFSLLRGICSRKLIDNPCFLDGNISGNVIEIDESLFGKKRKYHRGTGNQHVWIFGATEKNTRNAFLQIVSKRNRDNLLPIIKKYIKPGSTIYSDQWGAYFTLTGEGYNHDTVNHSKEFKSSSGCCTNTIEGLWGNVKLKIKKMKGILHDSLPTILDEWMYRYRFGHTNGDVYNVLISDIHKYYGFS